jgi:hypothetical protein
MTIVEEALAGLSPLIEDSSRLVFISHSHMNKDIAHDVKALLRPLGLNGFVAHDDIEPNAAWQLEILRNLRDCKGLIVVATDAARASPWVNQEIGAAVVRGIGTATLNCGVAPFGFLYQFQAAKWTPKEPEGAHFRDRHFLEANLPEICHALQKAGVVTQDLLIEGLGSAWSFEEARVVAKLIAESGMLEERQALRLAHLADTDKTARDCWEAQRLLPPLIKPHLGSVSPEVVKRLSDHGFEF